MFGDGSRPRVPAAWRPAVCDCRCGIREAQESRAMSVVRLATSQLLPFSSNGTMRAGSLSFVSNLRFRLLLQRDGPSPRARHRMLRLLPGQHHQHVALRCKLLGPNQFVRIQRCAVLFPPASTTDTEGEPIAFEP